MKKIIWSALAFGLVWCGAVASVSAAPEQMRNERPATPVRGADSDIIPVADSPFIGGKNAPVTIVLFADFQCPFCARAVPTLKQITQTYGKKVRVVFKHNPLSFHKDAPLASEAAMAAGEQGKFWEYHDLLYQNIRALKRDDLDRYAKNLGLNMRRFGQALDSGKFKKHIERDMALAVKVGARGTPNFFINGIKSVGARPFADFQTIIDKELADMGKADYKTRVKANFNKPSAPSAKNPSRPPANDTTVYKVPIGESPVRGNKNALVTVVVFNDFQCPFCSRAQPTLDKLLSNYKGQVRFVFKNQPLPFHKDAPLAAEAALAAGEQGKFWEFHDVLWKNQKQLKRDDLDRYAKDLGLNMRRFGQALDSGKFKKQIEADKALAAKLAARGTPTFFINGVRLVGAQPYEKFDQAVKDAQTRAKPFIDKRLKGDALYNALMKNAKPEFVAAPAPSPGSKPAADTTVHKIDIAHSPVRGSANAKVTIVSFTGFQCPFCGRVQPTLREVEKRYPGQVRFVFKHLPLPFHKNSMPAAIASLAAQNQGKFWEYQDVLWLNQKALTPVDLVNYARQVGLDIQRFERDMKDPKLAALVKADQDMAAKVGARGTPAFYINGRKLSGAQPVASFVAVIDEELKK